MSELGCDTGFPLYDWVSGRREAPCLISLFIFSLITRERRYAFTGGAGGIYIPSRSMGVACFSARTPDTASESAWNPWTHWGLRVRAPVGHPRTGIGPAEARFAVISAACTEVSSACAEYVRTSCRWHEGYLETQHCSCATCVFRCPAQSALFGSPQQPSHAWTSATAASKSPPIACTQSMKSSSG